MIVACLLIGWALSPHMARPGQAEPSGQREPNSSFELALSVKGMWRGYRGSPHSKPGYERHSDGLWYPKRAFGPRCASGDTGDACANDHDNWCRANYWSYRESDDTFQPYRGERRKCISPFLQ